MRPSHGEYSAVVHELRYEYTCGWVDVRFAFILRTPFFSCLCRDILAVIFGQLLSLEKTRGECAVANTSRSNTGR